jgi:hypothetical protein
VLLTRRTAVSALVVAALSAAVPMSYWMGYRAGSAAGQPRRWALVETRRNPGGGMSESYTWYDLNDRSQAAKMERDRERLRAAGASFRLAEGEVESSLRIKPARGVATEHR